MQLKSTFIGIFSVFIFYGVNAQCGGMSLSLASTNVTCYGGSNGTITPAVTGGTAPYIYSWSGGNSSTSVNIDSTPAAASYVIIQFINHR